MRIAELLLPEYDAEIATTRTVLKQVPDGDGAGEWKPHPKAFSFAHLAQLVAMLPGWVSMVLHKTELDIAPKDGPRNAYSTQTTAALLELFEKNAREGREALANATDEDFAVQWTLKAAGNPVLVESRYTIMRQSVFNHLVHHRAQLQTYLRIHGEHVPSVYGPSGDEKGFPGGKD